MKNFIKIILLFFCLGIVVSCGRYINKSSNNDRLTTTKKDETINYIKNDDGVICDLYSFRNFNLNITEDNIVLSDDDSSYEVNTYSNNNYIIYSTNIDEYNVLLFKYNLNNDSYDFEIDCINLDSDDSTNDYYVVDSNRLLHSTQEIGYYKFSSTLNNNLSEDDLSYFEKSCIFYTDNDDYVIYLNGDLYSGTFHLVDNSTILYNDSLVPFAIYTDPINNILTIRISMGRGAENKRVINYQYIPGQLFDSSILS